MNWKLILGGGLAYYVAAFAVSFATGPLIHNGILLEDYAATATFWRPELREVPPDMAALLPLWITTGLIGSFVLAGLYGLLRGSFAGPGWQRGIKFGICAWLFNTTAMLGWSGVFDLPYKIWGWWAAEGLVYFVVGGIALGFVAEKLAPAEA